MQRSMQATTCTGLDPWRTTAVNHARQSGLGFELEEPSEDALRTSETRALSIAPTLSSIPNNVKKNFYTVVHQLLSGPASRNLDVSDDRVQGLLHPYERRAE